MSQIKTLKKLANNSLTKVLAVTSGKGGVGKTNIIANLAYSLRKLGKKVLLLDADVGLGNIDVLLGLSPKYNISHVISGKKTLKEIIVKGPGNFDIIPASSGIQEVTNLKKNEKLILMEQIDEIGLNYDYFLIDTGAGIYDTVTFFCNAAQEIFVVATPDPTSITDAYALMKVMNKKFGENEFNLIVNFVKTEKEAMNVYANLSLVLDRYLSVKLNFTGFVLNDTNLVKSVRNQKLICELFPESRATKCFKKISRYIDRMDFNIEKKGSLQFFWSKLLGIWKWGC